MVFLQSVEEKIVRHAKDGTVTSRFGFNSLKMLICFIFYISREMIKKNS